MEVFFDDLVTAPLQVPFGKRPGYLSSGAARGKFFALQNALIANGISDSAPHEIYAGAFSMASSSKHVFSSYRRKRHRTLQHAVTQYIIIQ